MAAVYAEGMRREEAASPAERHRRGEQRGSVGARPTVAACPCCPDARLEIAPCGVGETARLRAELGCSDVLAQVLVRRGLADPAAAQAFLAAEETHPPGAIDGIERAVETILRHARAGGRIVVHGDYDVDGVTATAVLVRSPAPPRGRATVVHPQPARGRLRAVRSPRWSGWRAPARR